MYARVQMMMMMKGRQYGVMRRHVLKLKDGRQFPWQTQTWCCCGGHGAWTSGRGGSIDYTEQGNQPLLLGVSLKGKVLMRVVRWLLQPWVMKWEPGVGQPAYERLPGACLGSPGEMVPLGLPVLLAAAQWGLLTLKWRVVLVEPRLAGQQQQLGHRL